MAEGSGATSNVVGLSADIVAAYVTKNHIQRDELPALIATVHEALRSAAIGVTEPPKPEPVIPPNKSVRPDHIVCLLDGKKFKSLKRHLSTNHNMTPQEYRATFGLRPDYPMVAPAYASARSDLARAMGLGRKGGSSLSDAPEPTGDSSGPEPEAPSERRPKVAAKRASGGSRKKSAKVPVKGKAKKKEEPLGAPFLG
jgi:predicted transcriptional regulator